MTASLVLTETDNGVTVVTLNRPEALNALSRALRGAIVETFERLRHDTATEVVILTGAGRAFTAGIDLKELGGERDPDPGSVSDRDLARSFGELGKPIIGAINGYAITGGFEIALMCDFLIASTAARFADTHARVGVVPGWGLSQKLPRLIGINRAKELSLTGNFLSAEQAEEWGLVNRVVAPADLLPTCLTLARDMLSCEPKTIRAYKALIDRGFGLPFAEAIALERDTSREHVKQVSAADVAARRQAIQARGRRQGGS